MDERTHARYMSDIAYFLSKMEAEPNSGYFIPIALAYNKLEKYDETIAMCKTAIERFPSNCAAKTFLAEAYVYKGQFDLAKDLLFDVTAEDDNNYKAYKLLGIICRHNDENTEALKYLTGAYIRAPEDEEVKKMIDELGGTLNPDEIYAERNKKNQQSYDEEEDEDLKTYQTIDQKIRNAELVMADLVSDSSIGKGKSKEPEEEIVSDNPDDYVPLITSISKEKADEAPAAENIVISTHDSEVNEVTDEDIDRLHKAKIEIDMASGNTGSVQSEENSDNEFDLVNALNSTDNDNEEKADSEEELASLLNAEDDEFDLVSDLTSDDEKDLSDDNELSLISELTDEDNQVEESENNIELQSDNEVNAEDNVDSEISEENTDDNIDLKDNEESKADEELLGEESDIEDKEDSLELSEDNVDSEISEENTDDNIDLKDNEESKADEESSSEEINIEDKKDSIELSEDNVDNEISEENTADNIDLKDNEESKADEELSSEESDTEDKEDSLKLSEDNAGSEISEENTDDNIDLKNNEESKADEELSNEESNKSPSTMLGMTIEDMIDDDFEYGKIIDRDNSQDNHILSDESGVPFMQDNIMDEILDAAGMTHEELAEESERLVLDSKKERSIERLEKMLEKIKEMKGSI